MKTVANFLAGLLGFIVYGGLVLLVAWSFGQLVLAPLILWLRGRGDATP